MYKNIRSSCFFLSFLYKLLVFAFALVSFSPATASAVQVKLEWDENSEADIAGYRVFCRQEDQSYDYNNPIWEGLETTCTIDLDDSITHYFVARAYDILGDESGNSNEVCYEKQDNDQTASDSQLVFTPDTISFSVEEGGNASSQTTLDTSDGISTSYTVDGDATWLTVTPAPGSTPATLNVSIDATGLTPGAYAATISAIAMGYIEDTVGVTLTVTSFTDTDTGSIYDLLLSFSRDRSNPVYLDSEIVTGDIYVFTSPDVDISQVQFFLDDPQMTGDPVQIERKAPYDFAASTSGQAYGYPYDTTQLADGTHEITALIKLDDGGSEVVSSSFSVVNNESQLVFRPETLSISVEEGGNASSQTTLDTSDGISTSYTVDGDATWLTVTPAPGSTPATLNVSIDATGLTPGAYAATISAIAMGYIEDTVGVTLTVTSFTDTDTGSIYDLLLSFSRDRSNPVYLDSEIVTGDIYVFTSPDVDISQVQFFLDDPQMTGDPVQIERKAPYDFAASTSGQVYGYPYDTSQLPDGTHEITALIKLDDGGSEVVSSTFTVAD